VHVATPINCSRLDIDEKGWLIVEKELGYPLYETTERQEEGNDDGTMLPQMAAGEQQTRCSHLSKAEEHQPIRLVLLQLQPPNACTSKRAAD
jgi:hypothetical protein